MFDVRGKEHTITQQLLFSDRKLGQLDFVSCFNFTFKFKRKFVKFYIILNLKESFMTRDFSMSTENAFGLLVIAKIL